MKPCWFSRDIYYYYFFKKAYCSCSFEVCRRLPTPYPHLGFWGGAPLFQAAVQTLIGWVEGSAKAAVSDVGLPEGDMGT